MLGGTRVVGGVRGPLQILKGEPREYGTGLPGNLPLPTHLPMKPSPFLPLWSAILGLGSWDIVTVVRWGPGIGRGALLLILAS